jgi:hypothetical protein
VAGKALPIVLIVSRVSAVAGSSNASTKYQGAVVRLYRATGIPVAVRPSIAAG